MRILFTVGLIIWSLMTSARAWDGADFRVCADPNNPPYSEKSQAGFENKIAKLFAEDLKKKLTYEWFPQRMGFARNTLNAKLEDQEEAYKCDVIIGVPTGYERAATTTPYYRSTYAMVFRPQVGLGALKGPEDLEKLPLEQKAKLRIAMFDGSPATTWLLKHGLLEQGVAYQSMTGDASVNTAQKLLHDFKAKKLDVAIVWGPIAGYVLKQSKPNDLAMIPMHAEEGVVFDFPMAMGVRFGDETRRAELNALIAKHKDQINRILESYRVPLLPLGGPSALPDKD